MATALLKLKPSSQIRPAPAAFCGGFLGAFSQRCFAAPSRNCPVLQGVPSRPTSFPPDEVNQLMMEAIKNGSTVEEAMKRTEAKLEQRYGIDVSPAPCPAGGDKAPKFVQEAFFKVPRPVIEGVHALWKRLSGSDGARQTQN